MQKYKLNKDISISDCEVELNDEQAKKYDHRVSPVEGKKNLYKINGTTTFFIKDEIGIDIKNVKDTDKSFLEPVTIIESVKEIIKEVVKPAEKSVVNKEIK